MRIQKQAESFAYRLATPRADAKIINVNEKDYIVHPPSVGLFVGTRGTVPEVSYPYWNTRDGDYFGPSRTTQGIGSGAGKALYDAAREAFGADHDQMLADYAASQNEYDNE